MNIININIIITFYKNLTLASSSTADASLRWGSYCQRTGIIRKLIITRKWCHQEETHQKTYIKQKCKVALDIHIITYAEQVKKRRNCETTIVLILQCQSVLVSASFKHFCANFSRSLVLGVYTNFRRFTLIVARIICPQKILKLVGAKLKRGDTGSYLI